MPGDNGDSPWPPARRRMPTVNLEAPRGQAPAALLPSPAPGPCRGRRPRVAPMLGPVTAPRWARRRDPRPMGPPTAGEPAPGAPVAPSSMPGGPETRPMGKPFVHLDKFVQKCTNTLVFSVNYRILQMDYLYNPDLCFNPQVLTYCGVLYLPHVNAL